jgi:predicted aspartyl protease
LTRRALVNFGTQALAAVPMLSLAGRAFAAPVAPSAMTDSIPSVAASSDFQKHLKVEVLIDSQGPFHFVVDTGADRTVLARDIAERLGLSPGPRVMVEGIVRTIPADTALVRSLSLGPVTKEALELPLLPRALLGADGFLGLDAIGDRSVIFNFTHSSLRIESDDIRSNLGWNLQGSSPRGSRVQAHGPSGHLKSFDCRVDGVDATAFIDSGAEITIGNSVLAEALLAHGRADRELGKILITGVTGGQLEGRIFSIRKVRMGGLWFGTPLLAIADLQIFDLWGLSRTPALLIGMNYLRTFSRVTIDYGREQFRFELADIPDMLRA